MELLASKYGAAETGALRESIGTKIKTNLVPYELLVCAAAGLNYGEQKYDARNFEKGLSYADLLESIKRHVAAIENREELDEDSGLPHYALLASSVAMLCHNILQGVVIEDRPPAKAGLSISAIAVLGQQMQAYASERTGGPK